jgi:hypothetical protein
MTHMQFAPNKGDGIVILTNSQRSWPFIARILRYWTNDAGLIPTGMEMIIAASNLLNLLIILGFITMLFQAINLVSGLVKSTRIYVPFSRRMDYLRIFRLLQFVLISILFLKYILMPYSLLESVFPRQSNWLLAMMLSNSAVILLKSIWPKITEDNVTNG